MANLANNPLFKHFRQPAIYLKLPSQGQFYPDSAIDFPATGEIPVFPMTVKDEITLKTPDALMNGAGVVDVIRSCLPNIKDPWAIPAIDVDAIFIALRLASYGEGMDIKTTCPHCKEENEHTIDLRHLLDHLKLADYSVPLTVEGLTFKFKPQTYASINQASIINFEEQRLISSVLNNSELTDEEKMSKFAPSFEKLKDLNVNFVAVCIESITVDDETKVTDQKQIQEFLENSSRIVYNTLKDKVQNLINDNKANPIELACTECLKDFTTELTFDQSNFFG
jgi:hypothetical protein